MLVCDTTIRDAETGKVSLIGIFERIWAGAFPATHGSLSVYAKIEDAEGDYAFRLELVHLGTLRVAGRVETPPMRIPSRLESQELIFRLDSLVLPAPGRYEFRLLANGHFVGHKAFEAAAAPPPTPAA
jgi:hypothetical protein